MKSMTRTFALLAVAALVALAVPQVHAAVLNWNGVTGDWYAAGNWTPSQTPQASDTRNISSGTATLTTGPDLTINGGGSINLSGSGTINRSTTHWTRFGEGSAGTYTQSGGVFTSNSGRLYMGRAGGNFTADISGGTFSYVNGGDFIVGNDTAVGTLNISGGTFNVTSGNFRLGVDNSGAGQGNLNISSAADVNLYWLSIGQGAASSKGHATVTGGTLDTTRDLRVGLNGTGTFDQSGGTVTSAAYFYVGQNGGTGTYNLDGGVLQVNGWDSYIARGGTGSSGTFAQTDGQFQNAGWLNIGALNGGTGAYTISGGTLTTGTLAVGREGYGTMTISGTAAATTNGFYVGYYAAAAGSTMQVTGGTLNIGSASYIGRAGDATFTQTGGTVNGPNADLFVGYGASDATLTVSGGLFSQTGGNFRVGVDNTGSGQGNLTVSGGDVDLQYLSVAQGNTGSRGHVTVNSGTLDMSREFRVGLGGTGTYTQDGGTVTAIGGGDHFIGLNTGSGTVTVNDGTLTHTGGNTRLGVNTAGYLNIHGGDVNLNWLSMGQGNANSEGHVVMTGGTLDVNQRIRVGTSNGAAGTFTQTGGTVGGTNVRPVWVGEGGSTGTYTMGGGILNTSELQVGLNNSNSDGTFSQYGGTVNVSGNTFIGRHGGTGALEVSGGILNLNGADVYLARDGSGTGTATQTDGDVNVNSWLNIGAHSAGYGEWNISGGTLDAPTLAVGREGLGRMTIGGTATVTATRLYVGYYAAAAGSTMEVTGGTLNMGTTSYIGREGDVTFTQSGGTINGPNADLFVGYGPSDATLNLNGGLFSQTGGNFRVGVDNSGSGQGTLNVNGGNVSLNYLSIAQGGPTSDGHALITSGTVNITHELRVAMWGGSGTYTQDGGVVTASGGGDHFIGQGGGTGVMTINGGTLNEISGNTRVGVDGPGYLNIHGGDANFYYLSIGQGGTVSDGHVAITGGTTDITRELRVGMWGGTGTYTQSGGVVTVHNNSFIGRDGSTGTFSISDGQINFNYNDVYIGRGGGGQGYATQTGGDVNVNSWLNIGADAAGYGEWNVSGGTLDSATMAVGREGLGNMTILGTGDVTTNTLWVGYHGPAAGSELKVEGGSLTVNGVSTVGRATNATLNQTAGTVTAIGTLNLGDAGAGGTGTYMLHGGLLKAGTITQTAGSTLDFSGGTLDARIVDFALTNQGGTLSPADGAGITETHGDYIQEVLGTFLVELGGLGQGTEHDWVDVTGSSTLEGLLDVSLITGFVPYAGDYFDILAATGTITENLTLIGDQPGEGFWWLWVLDGDAGGQILRLQVSPEPSTLVLAAMAFLGIARRRRRRR